jgi:hypothetical protein
MRADRALAPPAAVTVIGWPGLRYVLRVSGSPSEAVLTVREQGEPGNQVVSSLR